MLKAILLRFGRVLAASAAVAVVAFLQLHSQEVSQGVHIPVTVYNFIWPIATGLLAAADKALRLWLEAHK